MKIKYPRTHHLPWSASLTQDDCILFYDDHFKGSPVIVTEKMDGENCNLCSEGIYARSIDSPITEWRIPVKDLWARLGHKIPKGFRICGENVSAVHSINYTCKLPSVFLAFSVWENDTCFDWQEGIKLVEMICEDAGLPRDYIKWVPVLYQGVYDLQQIHSSWINQRVKNGIESEGYVIRKINSFSIKDFHFNVGKYVRCDHVQTSSNWTREKMKYNDFL